MSGLFFGKICLETELAWQESVQETLAASRIWRMKMGKNSIFREFFRYVGLNVLGMIGLSCYILADTYFVSKALGTSGLAALNLAISVYSVIMPPVL